MKKIIRIIQENVEPLLIEDENEEDLTEYSAKLANLLSVGNVVVLETSTSNTILRPNKIVSIVVNQEGKAKRVYKKKSTAVIKEDTVQEDIITDGE